MDLTVTLTPHATDTPSPLAAPAVETPPSTSAEELEHRFLLPVYPHMAIEPVAGDGVWLTTRDGRRLLDFYGGHAVALLGYSNRNLLERLRQQAETLLFQSNVVPLAVRARAAERLVGLAPAGLTHAFLVNSGAEANENALRLAITSAPPGRTRVLALEGAFHGRTAAAGAVTHGAVGRWYGFPRTPFAVTFVPRGDLDALDAALTDDVAAMIVEPIQGVAGAVDLGADYLAAARERTAAHGVRLIFDEVQSGMGRTGYPFAAQLYGVTPDLLTTAKGLAGGFPAGAVLASAEIAGGVAMGALGSTFGGGPLACAAIEAVIDALEDEALLPGVRRLSGRLRNEAVGIGPVVGVQGEGFLLGLRTDRPAKEVQAALLAAGILTGGSGDPNIVRLLPPLVIDDSHVDLLLAALAAIPPLAAPGEASDPASSTTASDTADSETRTP
jgi:acetylornithine/succinyldiaminopimelate/putrescine aminotransferase